MLEKTNYSKPKIDISLCSKDNGISPINQVKIMDDVSFEHFVSEWVYVSNRSQDYKKIYGIGGSGDKGRDVIGERNDQGIDYFQCKHYQSTLGPSDFWGELVKLCYFTYIEEYDIPKNYYIIASNGIGPKLDSFLKNPSELKKKFIEYWKKNDFKKLIKNVDLKLTDEMEEYVKELDFSIIQTIPIEEIINEHLNSIYGKLRFGGRAINQVDKINVEQEEWELNDFVKQLFQVYSEKIGENIENVVDLQQYEQEFNHFIRQREDFYLVESVFRFVRDTFTNEEEFEILLEDILSGIIDVFEKEYSNSYERLYSVLQQASTIPYSKSILDKDLGLIGVKEKKGACHKLVNNQKINWWEAK